MAVVSLLGQALDTQRGQAAGPGDAFLGPPLPLHGDQVLAPAVGQRVGVAAVPALARLRIPGLGIAVLGGPGAAVTGLAVTGVSVRGPVVTGRAAAVAGPCFRLLVLVHRSHLHLELVFPP